jgi:hypothetical protein
MSDRIIKISEQHTRPRTEAEIIKYFSLVAGGLIGYNGFGDWEHDGCFGHYVVRGIQWSGKVTIQVLSTLSVKFPVPANDCMVTIWDITNNVIVNEYVSFGDSYVLGSQYLGRKIMLIVNQSSIEG